MPIGTIISALDSGMATIRSQAGETIYFAPGVLRPADTPWFDVREGRAVRYELYAERYMGQQFAKKVELL